MHFFFADDSPNSDPDYYYDDDEYEEDDDDLLDDDVDLEINDANDIYDQLMSNRSVNHSKNKTQSFVIIIYICTNYINYLYIYSCVALLFMI